MVAIHNISIRFKLYSQTFNLKHLSSYKMPHLESKNLSGDAANGQSQTAHLKQSLPTCSQIKCLKTPLHPQGEKSIKINACGELYHQLCKENPLWYRSAPKGAGIDFEVAYYDTLELLPQQIRAHAPTICLLHGAPGHYSNFSDLIQYLSGKGCRVIAPCFPTHEAVVLKSFRHSPRERVDYLRSFFRALKVDHLDMILGHSSSIYTIFELLSQNLTSSNNQQQIPTIKSIGLLSFLSYELPASAQATSWRMFVLKMFDYPFLRPFMDFMMQSLAHLMGIRIRADKMNDMLVTASTVGHSDYSSLKLKLGLIRQFKIPTFVMYGCLDKLIPVEYFEQLVDALGVAKSQMKSYDKNGELLGVVEGLEDDLVEVSRYLEGGHYAFQKYSRQVNQDLYQFLVKKVLDKSLDTFKVQ